MDISYSSSSSLTSGRRLSRYSIRSDSEALDAQLDRLKFTLQGMGKIDTDILTCSSRRTETNEREEELSERLETFIVNHDRMTMIGEDFRSFEMREKIKKSKKCSLEDLYSYKETLENAIRVVESGLGDEVLIQVPGKKTLVSVEKKQVFTDKVEISKMISKSNYENLKNKSPENLEDFLLSPFSDSIPIIKNSCQAYSRDIHSQINIEVEYKNLKELNRFKSEKINELEWAVIQNKIMKSSLESRSKKIADQEDHLKKQVKDFQTELNKQQMLIENTKSQYSSLLETTKAQQSLLDLINSEYSASTEVLRNSTNLVPAGNESYASISHQIQLLEESLENSLDKDSVLFKINKLKTKLSTLRSAKALNILVKPKRGSSFTSKSGNSQNKVPIPKLKNRTSTLVFEENRASNSTETLIKFLEIKENRIRKQEQELLERETRLQSCWKVKETEEIIQKAQENMMYWTRKSQELSDKEKELEVVLTENLEFKEKIKEIQKKSEMDREKIERIGKIVMEVNKFSI